MQSQWPLGSITMNKASGGDGIPVISNPKKWCCESAALNMPANLENSVVATGLVKVSFHSNPKECSNYCTISLISQASKVMLKILQARLQQYMNHEFQMFKLDLQKAEEPEISCQHLLDHRKSKRNPEKHLLLLCWLCQSLWLCGSQQTVENSSRDGTIRPSDLPLEKSVFRSGSNS